MSPNDTANADFTEMEAIELAMIATGNKLIECPVCDSVYEKLDDNHCPYCGSDEDGIALSW
jgi:rubrerythrin